MDHETINALKTLVDKEVFTKAQIYDLLIERLDYKATPIEDKPTKRKYTKRKTENPKPKPPNTETKRRWSNTDDYFLINNHNIKTIEELSIELNRTNKAISKRIEHLKDKEKI